MFSRTANTRFPLASLGLPARALLGVPLLGKQGIEGSLTLVRREPGRFAPRIIELVQTFADQAVIAIENARLFEEVQARTHELSESLQQQTATAGVLEVISRSAFDLQTVFNTVAESAVRLCGADRAFIFRFDGELLRMVVAYNASAEFTEFVRQNPIRPGRHSGSARAALERRTVQIVDVRDDAEYSYGIIQGGDPLLKDPKTARNLWGTGGLNLLKDEFSDLKHERGVVSTVRVPGKADSDGSQFFVCVSPQPQLDGQFSSFGRVTEGMDVVEKISQAPADSTNLTKTPVRILTVTIEKKRVEPFLNATPEQMRKTVVLNTTLGVIKIKMEPDWAPNHVRNFLKLTASGWYNGTSFHRLIKGFVVQGGMSDSRAGGAGHPADRWVRPVKGEFRDDVKHTRGIVSMARSDDPDSATTSFFLMLGDAPHLDGKYSAFGRIVSGLEVLDAFEKEEVDGEKPKRRLELIEATIE